MVQKGDSLIEINPGIYQAQVLQAQGALERDTNLLAEARMDRERYRAAWARNGIPKQTLDDQEKLVLQDEGTIKNDQGTLQYDLVQLGYLSHHRTDHGPRGPAPCGPRQRGSGLSGQFVRHVLGARGRHTGSADYDHLYSG
jgi:hypothetical protein